MHKCNNCGAEFQGHFCPNCGTSANQTPDTPQQNECPPAQNTKKQRNPQKVRAVLSKIVLWLPAAHVLMLGAVVFAFLAAPAVSLLGFGQSFYSALTDVTMASYKLPLIFAMAFAGISVAVGMVLLVLAKKGKSNPMLTLCLTLAAYFALFVISCVAMSQATRDGMQAGAASILILTFTILGMVISVASFIIDCNLSDKHYSLPKITVNVNKAIKAFWLIPQILLAVFCVVILVSFMRQYTLELQYHQEEHMRKSLFQLFTTTLQRVLSPNYRIHRIDRGVMSGIVMLLCAVVASIVYLICRIRATVRLLLGKSASAPQIDIFFFFVGIRSVVCWGCFGSLLCPI